MQQAFLAYGGAQCGICTPGMILAAVNLARAPSRADRRRDSRGARRKSLPLHRLHENFRIRASLRAARPSGSREVVSSGIRIGGAARSGRRARSHRARAGRMEAFRRRHGFDGAARSGKLPHKKFLSIWKLPELRGIEVTPEHVTLGALTTYTDVRRNATARRRISAALPAPPPKPAASRRKIAARSAETSRTLRPPRIRRPRCWSTMRNWNLFRRAARAGRPTMASTPATRKWTCAPTS